jgi:hypothetical protein
VVHGSSKKIPKKKALLSITLHTEKQKISTGAFIYNETPIDLDLDLDPAAAGTCTTISINSWLSRLSTGTELRKRRVSGLGDDGEDMYVVAAGAGTT